VAGPSSSSTALAATPSGPSGGGGGRGGRRRRGRRGRGTTPPPPRAPSAQVVVHPGPPSATHGRGRISMWPFQAPGGAHRPPAAAMFTGAPVAPFSSPWTPPGAQPGPVGWDLAALARSFNTMTLAPPADPVWIANSGATYHTTSDPGILSSVHPSFSHPSSIMVANGSCLPITSVGAAHPHGPFRLPDVLVAPSMVHNLLSIRRFIANNSCSVEFDSSDLTVKDLAFRHPLLHCDSTEPLYTLRFPASATSSTSTSSAAFATTTSTTWHRRLGHPGRDA
jgi:hypothetical protein